MSDWPPAEEIAFFLGVMAGALGALVLVLLYLIADGIRSRRRPVDTEMIGRAVQQMMRQAQAGGTEEP